MAADVELHASDGNVTIDISAATDASFHSHGIRGKIDDDGNGLTVHTADGRSHWINFK